ncbi:MAG: Mth938-like domain-containing protein [Rickettsiales bacterium]
MQDLTPRLDANAQLIQSYGPGGFRIANTDYSGAVAIFCDRTVEWDGELSVESVLRAIEIPPPVGGRLGGGPNMAQSLPITAPPQPSPYGGGDLEVLLIGTGARHVMLPRELRDAIVARGLAVDTMATGAAARTFNILLGEARRVVALLMLP